ncbi:hypothetical protein BsWGS_27125 [Bradybaena similaris]
MYRFGQKFAVDMLHVYFLMAVLMYCSVVAHGSDNMKEETGRESPMDDNAKTVRTAPGPDESSQLCGRKQANGGRSFDGNELIDNGEYWDDINSTSVSQGDLPWHVNVLYNTLHSCSGVIVNEYWVLTHASCVIPVDATRTTLIVGDLSLKYEESGQKNYSVLEIFLHPNYRSLFFDDDIALLKVRPTDGRGIRFNNYIQPICLPMDNEDPSDGSSLTISGWGGFHGAMYMLQKITLPVANLRECKRCFYPTRITDKMLCLQRQSGTIWTTYFGMRDFGGPATSSTGGAHIIHGITNFALNGASGCPQTVVLINVVRYITWIYNTIRDESDPGSTQHVIPPRTVS